MEIIMKITYEQIRKNEAVSAYIDKGNEVLGDLGFTDHSQVHAVKVAVTAAKILEELGYDERVIELARIAGYMHDMGNSINRNDHAHTGAIMAFTLLTSLGMDPADIAEVISAIGNHDENTGRAHNPLSAAIIIADKTDVRRNRVRNNIKASFDMHDRVNYAAISSSLEIDVKNKVISLDIELDEKMCTMLDYFEIFLNRMLMCRRAAEILGLGFSVLANGSKVI